MKLQTPIYLSIFFIATLFINSYSQSCDDAFSAANYSVAHTRKAYESTNTDHVQEWSEKALETFSEVENITIDCGCEDVANFAYEGYEAAEKCLEQNTWERSRFYAKRAKERARSMIDALAKCTNRSISQIENSSFDYNQTASIDDEITSNDIAESQKELEAQQQELLMKQRELANKIAAQKEKQAVLLKQRNAELIKQRAIMTEAEINLAQLQNSFEKLAQSIGCNALASKARVNFKRSDNDLKNENLEDTKAYYVDKLNEISENALLLISECQEN